MKAEIQLFQGSPVRMVEVEGKKRASAVDLCAAMGYADPRSSWVHLKTANPELAEISVVSKIEATDGKSYDSDTLDMEGAMNLGLLARTKKGFPK